VATKEPFSFKESHHINIRFYFEEDEELNLEVIPNSNSKDKIQVKKDEALINSTKDFMSNS
jgi:hypothetical protein